MHNNIINISNNKVNSNNTLNYIKRYIYEKKL